MRRILYTLLVLLIGSCANAQMVNNIPNYLYSGSLGVGRSTANDANAYLQVGPNGAGTKGMLIPWVADTSAVTGTKRNFLLIRSSQLGNFAYWDSIGSKWVKLGVGAIDTTTLSTRAWRQKGLDSLAAKIPSVDTTTLSTRAWRQKGIDSLAAKIPTIDTTVLSTRAYAQKIVNDTAKVLRSLSGGGSSSLSSLTAATAANTINNGANIQEWQWNSLYLTGLKLSSTATISAAYTHKLFESSISGSNAISDVSTYAGLFNNNRTGTGAVNYGISSNVSDGTINYGIRSWAIGGTTSYGISAFGTNATTNYGSYSTISGSTSTTSYNYYAQSYVTSGTSYGLYANIDGSGGTTNYGMYLKAANATNNYALVTNGGNAGFGTTAPSSKAIVEMSSTTQGFLPPRMTTTQRDAITSPPAGLMVYDTTVNKVSVYNGSVWKYLVYE